MHRKTNKIPCLSLFLIIFVVLLGTADFVIAEDSLADQLDEIKAKIKAYQQIVDLKQKEGSALSNQIESLQAQADSLQLQITTNQKTIAELEGQISDLNNRIREKESVIEVEKRILSGLMQNHYLNRSQTGIFVLASDSSEFNPFQADEWMSETGDKLREVLATLHALRTSLVEEQNQVVSKKINADTLKVQLAARNDYLESVQSNKTALLAKTQRDVAKYDSLVDDLEKQQEELESEIEAIESGKLDSLNLKDMPAFKHGVLKYPLKSYILSQGYGKTSYAKKSGSYGRANFHNGLDFAASSGSSIYAAAKGKVVATGNNGRYAYGRWIAIDHGNGIVTLYGHLSKVSVSRGDSVDSGDKIGLVGSTGNSTGPHLHFTVFSAKTFDVVPSKSVSSVKDIPVGATVNPKVYLP